jgi:two-component system, LytTR family, sensor kinase
MSSSKEQPPAPEESEGQQRFSRFVDVPFWKVNILFWIVFGVAAFWGRLILHQHTGHALIFTVILELCTFGLSLVLQRVYQRTPQDFGLRSAFILIICSLGAALLQTLVGTLFTLFTKWHNPFFDFFVSQNLRTMIMWMIFMLWSLLYFWWQAEVRRAEENRLKSRAEMEARRIELAMLRAQLDPHFLFNSLNGIAAEIEPHPRAATAMVEELASYLRYSLDHRKKSIGVLSSELEAMAAYLEIEHARFGERLQTKVRATPAARVRHVPSFLLQPLVENAIKHGVNQSPDVVTLELNATTDGDLLEICVSNTGRLDAGTHRGVGLETLRRRLDLHYPKHHRFHLAQDGNLVRATLQLWGDPCSV